VKLRKRTVLLLVVAVLALGLGTGAIIAHQRGKRALADYQQLLIATGERLTVEELVPQPVASGQNGALLFYRAITLLNVPPNVLDTNPPSGMTPVAPGKARVGWAEPNLRSSEATNTWDEAIWAAEKISGSLDTLAELIERPTLDFGLNYQMGFTMRLPNLAQTKRAAQRLYYAELCDLHRRDAASATIRLRSQLALVQGSHDERLLISQLVRMAIAGIAFAGSWEWLQATNLTEEQLALVQGDWQRLEFLLAAENALTMERAIGQMMVEQMRDSSAEFRKAASGYSWPGAGSPGGGGDWFDQVQQFGKDTWNETRLKAKETAWRVAWSYPDQLRALKGQQVLIDSTRLARTNGNFGAVLARQREKLASLGIQDLETDDYFSIGPADVDFRTLLSQGVLSLTRFLDKVMKIEVSRQLIVTAIALQRYQLRHGNYPPELAALVPDYLPALPSDSVDGETLRYKSNSDGTFLLYSVGEDNEDNDGDPKSADSNSKSRQWQRGRDWVWPQPATQLEVEEFYRKQNQ